MDDEQHWNRIVEVVRLLAARHELTVPESLLRVSGDYWSRDAQRRNALNGFLKRIPGMPEFSFQQGVHEIADVLDTHALNQQIDESIYEEETDDV